MPRKVLSKPDVSIFTCDGGTFPGRYDCPIICPGGPIGPCGPGGPLCPHGPGGPGGPLSPGGPEFPGGPGGLGGPPLGGPGGLPSGGPCLEGYLPSFGDPSSPRSPSGDPPALLLLGTLGLRRSGGGHPPESLPDTESPSSPGELPSSPPEVCLGLVWVLYDVILSVVQGGCLTFIFPW